MCSENDKLLLAVSGGMDSMAMAELFYQAGYEFAFAHCNFQLRGDDSNADEAFVKQAADQYGVKCFIRSFETGKIAEDSGDSIQMVARDLRYAFFDEIASDHGFDRIATAHHLDDQIETFFINLMRGCGIAGLHGIPFINGLVIRPMMMAYRNDIEAFVQEKNLQFREDLSNQSLKYQRNKIRHELMPIFLEMNPSFRQEMTKNIHRLKGTEEIYKQVIALAKKETIKIGDGEISMDIKVLKMFKPFADVLYGVISEYGFKQDDVDNITRALEGISGKKFLSRSHQLIIDREKILISPLLGDTNDDALFIMPDTELIEDPLRLIFEKEMADQYSIPSDRNIAALDLEKLTFPLQLRKWQQGDSFVPLGMKNRKKLSDFFIDEKFSIPEKNKTWVLCSGDDIVWIVGHRIDDRYKITESTHRVFQIRN